MQWTVYPNKHQQQCYQSAVRGNKSLPTSYVQVMKYMYMFRKSWFHFVCLRSDVWAIMIQCMNCFGLLLSKGDVCAAQICCDIRKFMSCFQKSCRTSRLLMSPLYCQNLCCTYSSGLEGRIISIVLPSYFITIIPTCVGSVSDAIIAQRLMSISASPLHSHLFTKIYSWNN